MSSNKDCEYGIDCNKCKSRGMCTSYANHMYSIGLMQGRTDEQLRSIKNAKQIQHDCILAIDKARKEERERIVKELEELHERYLNRYGIVGNHSLSAIRDAIEIVKR